MATTSCSAAGIAFSVIIPSCHRLACHGARHGVPRGLPPPQLQIPVFGRSGTLIARVDFMWQEHRVVVEADGLLKYDSGQTAIKELTRDRLLREAGYRSSTSPGRSCSPTQNA